jgi:hypothetical protein
VPVNEQILRSQAVQEVMPGVGVRPGVVTGNENLLRNEHTKAKLDTPEGQLFKQQIANEQIALSKYADERVDATGASRTLINDEQRGGRINDVLYGTSPEGCMTDSCLTFTIDSTGWFPGGIMSEYTLNIVPDYTTGVEVLTNNIKVWPNPIGEVINISAPSNNTNVKIMSVDGKVVFSQNFNQKQIQIDGNLLSNGSYVIVMTDESGKVYTTRIIK